MLAQIRDTLALVHPDFPWVFLTTSIWLVQWLVRRFAPKVWTVAFFWVPQDLPALVRRFAQALPSIVVGAAVPAIAAGGSVRQAVIGAIFGAVAPIWHHLFQALPGPYQGELGGAVRSSTTPTVRPPGPA